LGDFEARINTKHGQIVIHFTDKLDLESKLKDVAEFTKLIDSGSSGVALVKEEDVPGLEGICKISSEGLPRIIVYPDSGSDKIRLALYASKRPLTPEEIVSVTGVPDPTAHRVMKFDEVLRSGGKYSLSGKGRTYFTSKVLPKLREKFQSTTTVQ
jgi:hypothetical protein